MYSKDTAVYLPCPQNNAQLRRGKNASTCHQMYLAGFLAGGSTPAFFEAAIENALRPYSFPFHTIAPAAAAVLNTSTSD